MEWIFIASAAASAISSYMGGQANAAAMRRQADLAEQQAAISKWQAEWTARMQLKAGADQANFIRRQSARTTGTAVTRVAGSGVELSGSPLDSIADQIHQDENAAATARSNAGRQAFATQAGGQARAAGYEAQAGQLRTGATVAAQAGFLDAIAKGTMAVGGYYKLTGYGSAGGYSDPGNYTASDFASEPGYQGDYATYGN